MASSIFGSKYKLTEPAKISKISAYLHTAVGLEASTAIYNDSSGSPDVLQASSNPIPLSSWSWHNFTLSATLPPGDYWLVLKCDSCYFRNSTGENQQWASRWDGTGDFPTQFDSVVGWENWNMSIFATYTPT